MTDLNDKWLSRVNNRAIIIYNIRLVPKKKYLFIFDTYSFQWNAVKRINNTIFIPIIISNMSRYLNDKELGIIKDIPIDIVNKIVKTVYYFKLSGL